MISIEQAAQLMARRFWDDPGIKAQMRGVVDAHNLFELQCLGQLRAYQDLGLLTFFEEGPSFSVGYRTDAFDAQEFVLLVQRHSQGFIEACSQDDLVALQTAIAPVTAISNPVWYEKHFSGPVYDLQIIVVDERLKGSGVFRKMVDPVLESCEASSLPAVLQTHNPANVPLYEHFGFKVVESPRSEDIGLTCYCMARSMPLRNV